MTHICVTCRQLLAADEPCDPGHVVTPVASKAHMDAVLGGVTPARPPRNSAVPEFFLGCLQWTGLAIAVTVIACLPFTLCTDHPIEAARSTNFAVTVAVVSVIVAIALIIEQVDTVSILEILRYPFPRRRRVQPRGVRRSREPSIDGPSGKVAGDNSVLAPLSNVRCAAWHVTLVNDDGDILLRASSAADFTVVLGDATNIRIPAGRIDLLGERSSSGDSHECTDWLARIAPSRPRGARDPLRADAAYELVVRVDDTVTVLGELRPQPADSDTSTYREAPAVELVPVTRAALRLA